MWDVEADPDDAIVPRGLLLGVVLTSTPGEAAMTAAVRRARAHGIATGLISHARGTDRHDPAPEIYLRGAALIDLPPAECVYVDDVPGNLGPARALGMTVVHHREPAATIEELCALFGADLTTG